MAFIGGSQPQAILRYYFIRLAHKITQYERKRETYFRSSRVIPKELYRGICPFSQDVLAKARRSLGEVGTSKISCESPS